MNKLKVHEAEAEAQEEKTWWCSDCGTATNEGQTRCQTCIEYWRDVANGVFDYE